MELPDRGIRFIVSSRVPDWPSLVGAVGFVADGAVASGRVPPLALIGPEGGSAECAVGEPFCAL
jgi:hypothetical protein